MDRLYGVCGAVFFAGFFAVVEACFCGGFCELRCAKRGFLCGDCGAIVVIFVVEGGGKMGAKK
jgi:hypothetical protein